VNLWQQRKLHFPQSNTFLHMWKQNDYLGNVKLFCLFSAESGITMMLFFFNSFWLLPFPWPLTPAVSNQGGPLGSVSPERRRYRTPVIHTLNIILQWRREQVNFIFFRTENTLQKKKWFLKGKRTFLQDRKFVYLLKWVIIIVSNKVQTVNNTTTTTTKSI